MGTDCNPADRDGPPHYQYTVTASAFTTSTADYDWSNLSNAPITHITLWSEPKQPWWYRWPLTKIMRPPRQPELLYPNYCILTESETPMIQKLYDWLNTFAWVSHNGDWEWGRTEDNFAVTYSVGFGSLVKFKRK